MRVRDAGLLVSTALPSLAGAMLVASGSPCYLNCGNVLTNTTGSDMVCNENAISNSVFQTCINCEITSTYSGKSQTDLQWLLCTCGSPWVSPTRSLYPSLPYVSPSRGRSS